MDIKQENFMSIVDKLKEECGFKTRKEFAKALNCHPTSFSKWNKMGVLPDKHMETIRKIKNGEKPSPQPMLKKVEVVDDETINVTIIKTKVTATQLKELFS